MVHRKTPSPSDVARRILVLVSEAKRLSPDDRRLDTGMGAKIATEICVVALDLTFEQLHSNTTLVDIVDVCSALDQDPDNAWLWSQLFDLAELLVFPGPS